MKFLLVFFVLLIAVVSSANDDKGHCRRKGCRNRKNYNIESVWVKHRRNKNKCVGKWSNPLQSFHDESERAFVEFEGDAIALGAIQMDSVRHHLSVLLQTASGHNNGTILSGGATAVLEAISRLGKFRESSTVILTEFEKVSPDVIADLKNVALNQRGYIGDVAKSFTDAADEFTHAASKYVRTFLKTLRASGCKKELNYEPTLKKLQILMNVMASIAETLLKLPDSTIEVRHSVLVLCLTSWWLQLSGQGINCVVRDVQFKNNCEVSENSRSLSTIFSGALDSMNKYIPVGTVAIDETIKEFLTAFINTTFTLNTAVKDVLGEFDGKAIAEQIAQNFLDIPKVA